MKETKKKKLQKTEKKETLKVHDVIWNMTASDTTCGPKKVLKINNGSKENRYAAAISWSGDTERREKNGDLFVIKKT